MIHPSFAFRCPQKSEGAGKTGCAPHPRSHVRLCKTKLHMSIQVWRKHSGLPCAMALRLIRFRPGDRLSCHHRPSEALAPSELDASTGASDPNDFAVRFRRARQSQHQRPSLPCPSFATMAHAPLVGQDGGDCAVDLPDRASQIFRARSLDGMNRFDRIEEISHGAQAENLIYRNLTQPTKGHSAHSASRPRARQQPAA